jgi:uncharacterized protein (DUF58 family)
MTRTGNKKSKFLPVFFLAALLLLVSIFSAGFFLYSAAAVAILCLISVGMASASLLGIKIHRKVSAEKIDPGESATVILKVSNLKSLAAYWIFGEDYIDNTLDTDGPTCFFKTIAPSKSHELQFRVQSKSRGFFRLGPATLESSGPFGLIRRFLVGKQVDFLTVLPRVVSIEKEIIRGKRPIHQIPRRWSIFEDPSRFIGVRDYRPGDSLRRIHWKATARSKNIQVKMFEPSVLTGALLAVDMEMSSYFQSKENKEKYNPLLELTITAAASIGDYILSGDQQVGLLSNGEDAADHYSGDWSGGSFRRIEDVRESSRRLSRTGDIQPVELPPGKGRRQQMQLLAALARLCLSDRLSLSRLLLDELPRLPRSLVLIVLTPVFHPNLISALDSVRRSGIEVSVVWIRGAESSSLPKEAFSLNIPVYPIRDEKDLKQLGGQSL